MRIDPEEYARLDLRAHSLLADVPLHDVWATDLPGGGPGRTVEDVRALLSFGAIAQVNPAVRLLFGLRALLGSAFGWDREPAGAGEASFANRLSEEDRRSTRAARSAEEGSFRSLYVSRREAISEIQNATVHAFLVLALCEQRGGYRLYWAVYVRPQGRGTAWYMALIDPFRRFVVYPSLLRHVRSAWARRFPEPQP